MNDPKSIIPLVSVVMPVYNVERYLAEAVESILAQTFEDFEFIIVDDGSTDGSLEILKRYEKSDSRIKLISRPNTGIAGARNDGLKMARGEFLASMDADDISFPTRFEKQLRYMNDHPECVVVGSDVQLIDPDGRSLEVQRKFYVHEEIEVEMLRGQGTALNQTVALMRRAAVEEVGGYQDRFSTTEDLDLYLRLAEIGRVANLPEVLLKYRVHFTGTNRSRFQTQLEMIPRIVAEAMERRGISSVDAAKLPIGPPPAEAEQRRLWARQFRRAGDWKGATHHALLAFRQEPLSARSLKLVYQLVRGR